MADNRQINEKYAKIGQELIDRCGTAWSEV